MSDPALIIISQVEYRAHSTFSHADEHAGHEMERQRDQNASGDPRAESDIAESLTPAPPRPELPRISTTVSGKKDQKFAKASQTRPDRTPETPIGVLRRAFFCDVVVETDPDGRDISQGI